MRLARSISSSHMPGRPVFVFQHSYVGMLLGTSGASAYKDCRGRWRPSPLAGSAASRRARLRSRSSRSAPDPLRLLPGGHANNPKERRGSRSDVVSKAQRPPAVELGPAGGLGSRRGLDARRCDLPDAS